MKFHRKSCFEKTPDIGARSFIPVRESTVVRKQPIGPISQNCRLNGKRKFRQDQERCRSVANEMPKVCLLVIFCSGSDSDSVFDQVLNVLMLLMSCYRVEFEFLSFMCAFCG